MSPPTDCSYVQPRLAPFVTGELDERTHRAVQAHVGACPVCHDELKRARAMHHLLRSSAEPMSFGSRLLVAQARPSLN